MKKIISNCCAELFDSAPIAYLTFDSKGRIREINLAGAEMLEKERRRLIGKPFLSYLTAADRKRFFAHLKNCEKTSGKLTDGLLLRINSAKSIFAEIITRAVRDSSWKEPLFHSVFIDITERRQAGDLLKRNEERMRLIIETANDAFVEINGPGLITDWNRQAESLFGWRRREALGRSLPDMIIPLKHRPNPPKFFQPFLAPAKAPLLNKTIELSAVHRDGHEFPVELTVWPLRNGEGGFSFNVFIRDISTRKQVESEVLNVSMREQQRIGQDLHDSICQELTGTAFLAKVLEQNLAKKGLPDTKDAKRIGEMIHKAITQTRSLARGLLAWEIETHGLAAALAELGANIEKLFNIPCSAICSPLVRIEEPVTAKHLYRIAQEAVGNAVKHGRAKKILVELFQKKQQIVLRITDDGIGFSGSVDQMKGMGLRIMKYRANNIGAALEIHKGTKGGTVVQCSISPARPRLSSL